MGGFTSMVNMLGVIVRACPHIHCIKLQRGSLGPSPSQTFWRLNYRRMILTVATNEWLVSRRELRKLS